MKIFLLFTLTFSFICSNTAYAQASTPGCSGFHYPACILFPPNDCPSECDLKMGGGGEICTTPRWTMQTRYCDNYTESLCKNSSGCNWYEEVLPIYDAQNLLGSTINLPVTRSGSAIFSTTYGHFDYLDNHGSSVSVPADTCLYLYADKQYDWRPEFEYGAKLILDPGEYNLGTFAFDNYASAWKIITSTLDLQAGVDSPCPPELARLYWGWDQKGDQFPVRAGVEYPMLGRFNDDASSIWVAEGACLILFRNSDFKSTSHAYGAGYHNLNGFNDQASSVRVLETSCSATNP